MPTRLTEIWVYLAASPLFGLTLTLLAYQGAFWLYRRTGSHPLANPVMLAVAMLVSILWITGTPYRSYFDGAQFVHFLLGPATVALAIPLHAQFRRLRAMALPLLVALVAGSLTAALSAVAVGYWLPPPPPPPPRCRGLLARRQQGRPVVAGAQVGNYAYCNGDC